MGSGTNYNALPENGGVPDETRQITELNNGKIWTAITDHTVFRIGNQTDDSFFEVDQQLGLVTIPEVQLPLTWFRMLLRNLVVI